MVELHKAHTHTRFGKNTNMQCSALCQKFTINESIHLSKKIDSSYIRKRYVIVFQQEYLLRQPSYTDFVTPYMTNDIMVPSPMFPPCLGDPLACQRFMPENCLGRGNLFVPYFNDDKLVSLHYHVSVHSLHMAEHIPARAVMWICHCTEITMLLKSHREAHVNYYRSIDWAPIPKPL